MKMKNRFILMLISALFFSAHAVAMTNQQLVEFCQQSSAIIDNSSVPQRLMRPYNQCHGFIDGFLAGLMTAPAILIGANKIRQNDWPVCLGDADSNQIATDLLHYVRDGGGYRKEQSANSILVRVVFDRYRCPPH